MCPQVMIDTNADSIEQLRQTAQFLTACADLRAGTDPNPLVLLPVAVAAAQPAPIAPSAPAPLVVVDSTTQPLPPDTEFDTAGMAWDARIHQSAKGKKQNGEWKLKKGIDLSVVEHVTKENLARKAVTEQADREFGQPHHGHDENEGAAAAPPPPPPPPVSLPATPPPPPPPAPVTAAPAAASPAVSTYRALMQTVVRITKTGKVTQEEVSAIVAKHGAPSLTMLNSMPHLIPAIDADLAVLIAERGI